MDLHSLLTNLSEKGVKLSADGDSLLIDAPQGAIARELRQALIEHKAELLLLLRQHNAIATVSLPAIVPAPSQRYEPFPLTDMQHAFWLGRSGVFDLGSVSNHGYYEIEGNDLNIERLNWALQKLIARHDMLRAIILPDGQQQIFESVPAFAIQVLDLRGQDEQAVHSQQEAIRDRLSHQVLPADRCPLFECHATLLDRGRVRLHVSYDLLVFDAWSLFRLFAEWFQLYQNPDLVLPSLELSFRDYVLAEQNLQQTELYRRSQDYWIGRLDSLPPPPDLPLAKNPRELKQPRCRRYDGRLESTDWQQLKLRATQAGLTPSGVLLAALAEVLALWSKNPRFTIDLALFNRLPLHPQVYDILGDFTSATLLAVDNSIPASFTDRGNCIQRQLWQDLEHRYFNGVRVTRELARMQGTAPSAIPVVFTSTLGLDSLGQETLTFSHFGELVYGISQASQVWIDVQVWEEKGALTFNWDVVEELFPEGLIADMFEAYCSLLDRLVTSESAWLAPTRQLVPPAQLVRRDAINATTVPVSESTLHALFTAQVRERAEATAVIAPQRRFTYREIYDRSNQVGRRLRQLGAVPNQLVAVVMEKGWEQIVAVLGILAAGAAYVPIDPDLPQERLLYLLENSEAKLVLTQSWLNETLELPAGVQQLCLDTEDLADESTQLLEPIQTADDLAYLIYTSGSTGLPKGVAIAHRGAVNTIVDINQLFGVSPDDRVLALSALNFDLSVYDIFGTLAAGGAIAIPEASLEREPAHWSELMVQHKVTIWNSVPALMQMMVDYAADNPQILASLRLALLSGDWLPLGLSDRLKALVPNVQTISLGGATEASIWSILYPIQTVDPTWKSIPYGRPMANQRFQVLNELLEPCPVWVPGQLYIGGIGLAKGYWRDEAKTATSFIAHPVTGERLYRTGDLGRYLPDGNIEFLGREDLQVKIGGYRIELGEIEAVLMQHPAVRQAVVTVAGEQPTYKRLVAYVVPEREISSEELRCFLGGKLPDYMLPSAFLFLDALPLSANGKVNRRALPSPDGLLQLAVTYVAPENEIEQTIVTIWQEVLDLEKVGVNDKFFEIGGNSLLLTKIYSKLKNVMPDAVQYLSIVDLFNYSTVRSLAQHLNADRSASTLQQQSAESDRELTVGKERLKQRYKKSAALS